MDQFRLNNKTSYLGLFREIYKQEKSFNKKDIIAAQKRKEELSKAHEIDLIDVSAVREDIENSIFEIEKRMNNNIISYYYSLKNDINLRKPEKFDFENPNPIDFLTSEDDKLKLQELRQKWEWSDDKLVEEHIEQINHQPPKKNHEYLEIAKKAKDEYFKKWSSISFRGIGASIGALGGGILGTVLFPGVGTATGFLVGGGIGGLFGLVVFGLVVNYFIVNKLIPFSIAYKQTFEIKKIRKKKSKKKEKSSSLDKKGMRWKTSFNEEEYEVILGLQLQYFVASTILSEIENNKINEQNDFYVDVINKYNKKFIKDEMPQEKKDCYRATIDNIFSNDNGYKSFTEPKNNRISTTKRASLNRVSIRPPSLSLS